MASFRNVIDAQFVELPVLDEEFDVTGDAPEALVVYDAFGGIQHTLTPHHHEAVYE